MGVSFAVAVYTFIAIALGLIARTLHNLAESCPPPGRGRHHE